MIKRIVKEWVRPLYQDVRKLIVDTLFPLTCIGCGTEGSFLCAECQSVAAKVPAQHCIHCRKPSPLGFTHPGCSAPFSPDGLVSFYDYHDKKISESIIQGKYYFLPGVFELLGKMVAAQILSREYKDILSVPPTAYSLPPASYTLVPLPLSSSRKRWRGFNQTEVLCNILSKELNLPIANLLIRNKSTKTQKDLKRDARLKNVANAFSINPKILNLKSLIYQNNFVLVDDVTTTGATLLEAVKVLKRNGADKVWCLTVASE